MIPQINYFLPTTRVFYLRTLNKGNICSTEHSSKILEDLRSQLNIFVYSASTFILIVDTDLHLFSAVKYRSVLLALFRNNLHYI